MKPRSDRPRRRVSRRRPAARRPAPRRIAMLAYPDVQILDVVGPLEVFARTSRFLRDTGVRDDDAYTVEILGLTRGALTASSGLVLRADHRYDQAGPGIDTLLIAGGRGTERHFRRPALLRWLRERSRTVRRIASICTGAYFLAEAGLLAGRRATTHWAHAPEFARRYPSVKVEPDTLYIRQGSIYTSAGVTAGMDLALALVEEDHGRDVALSVARLLVMFLRRPGGQAQFSAQLSAQFAEHQPLNELQAWIVDHPRGDLSVPALARRVAMSPRNFARVFTREVGLPPARFVTSVRVETARRLLEETSDDLESIAGQSGLESAEVLRRAFLRVLGVAPSQYRERFTRSGPAAARHSSPH